MKRNDTYSTTYFSWGLLGGNMNNNVVRSIASYFQRSLKYTTLRLDFRGVQVGWGYSEVRQVTEAAEFVIRNTAATKLLVVGYSYGSLIGASASANIPQCIGYIMIAPPFSVSNWLLLFNSSYHMKHAKENISNGFKRLMIIGSRDNFTSENNFRKTVARFPRANTTANVIDDADHFFFGIEIEVIKIVDEWVRGSLLR